MASESTAAVVTEAKTLTAENLPAYLLQHLGSIDKEGWNADEVKSEEDIVCNTIVGGNVNYAFCCKLKSKINNDTAAVFVKQAPEFVAIFGPDGFPLTSQRMQQEINVYTAWQSILGETYAQKYLPTIYFFDPTHMTVCMEFLAGHQLLDHVLQKDAMMSKESLLTISQGLGDFMGRTHAATHSSKITPEQKEIYVKEYENRPMRDIQNEFVFTKCYKEATDEQRAGLDVSEDFMKEVELLKAQYNGQQTDSLVLSHGDLHPGSVMVASSGEDGSSASVKVIDPEFTVYGPPGLDVGSLLSGYCLGAIHQAYSPTSASSKTSTHSILESCRAIWSSYVAALKEHGLSDNEALIREIEIETVGFTVAEVCRTALEFAGGRKWLQFEHHPDIRAAARKAALELVGQCMTARHTGGIDLLFYSLEKLVNNV